MTNKEFDALCKTALHGGSTTPAGATALGELVKHATALRVVHIEYVNRTDRWDEDWPLLGFEAYPEDPDSGEEFHDDMYEWLKKNGGE